jgi:uncharacterized protein (TIGR03118 family)
MIKLVSRRVGPATVIAVAVLAATAVRAGDRHHDGDDNRYVVTNLVSDIAKLGGNVIDPNLKNAWGVAFTPGASPFWIADNATGLSTLYDGDGTIVPVASPSGGVTIPCPPSPGQGSSCPPNPPPNNAAPTGMVWNPTSMTSTGFLVPLTGKVATFIWATEDGTISAWTGGLTTAVLAVNNALSRHSRNQTG